MPAFRDERVRKASEIRDTDTGPKTGSTAVLQGQGLGLKAAIRQIGVSDVAYFRWRREYGGLQADQLKRLKALERENERLRRAVSDLTLDKMILAEAARGNS